MSDGFKFQRRSKLLKILSSNDSWKSYLWIVWLLGFAQNYILLFYFDTDKESFLPDNLNVATIAINLTQISFILLLMIFWFNTKYQTNMKIQIADENSENRVKSRDGLKLSRVSLFLKAISSDMAMMQIIYHLIFSSLTFLETGFVGFHMLLLFNLTETMKSVVRSFTTHLDQLIYVFIFAFLILMSVALITVIYYNDLFDEGVLGPEAKKLCFNMFSCWLQVIDVGMRLGGSLADSQRLMDWNEDGFVLKWVYNMFNFFLFPIMFKLMIQGIMVDTFGELRA